MKKFLSFLLILTLAAALLAGCGKPAEKADWEYIADKGTLVIGMTIFDPMNYRDAEGNLTGFDTELAQAVCEKLGVKAEFIEIDWDNKVLELQSKSIDCIWNGMTITEDLKENIDFSMPYSENYQTCVINVANADKYTTLDSMAKAKIGVEAGSAGASAVAAEAKLAGCEVTTLAAQRNTLIELKSGTLDVAVIDAVMAEASVGEGTDYVDLMVVDGVKLSAEEYGIGLRKGSTVTAEKINDAIQQLANEGFLAQLQAKYPSVMVTVQAK